MNSRRLIASPEAQDQPSYRLKPAYWKGPGPLGSKADMCVAKSDVCFTPNSDRESGLPQKVMSALPPKADMCSAGADVRFGPKADVALLFTPPLRPAKRGEKDGQTGVK